MRTIVKYVLELFQQAKTSVDGTSCLGPHRSQIEKPSFKLNPGGANLNVLSREVYSMCVLWHLLKDKTPLELSCLEVRRGAIEKLEWV
jgi:hypothetical protein